MAETQRCCETCRHDLGGGYDNCRINLESECAAGEFEAWEPEEPDNKIVQYWDEISYWNIDVFKKLGLTIAEASERMDELCAVISGCIILRTSPRPRHIQIRRAKSLMRKSKKSSV